MVGASSPAFALFEIADAHEEHKVAQAETIAFLAQATGHEVIELTRDFAPATISNGEGQGRGVSFEKFSAPLMSRIATAHRRITLRLRPSSLRSSGRF